MSSIGMRDARRDAFREWVSRPHGPPCSRGDAITAAYWAGFEAAWGRTEEAMTNTLNVDTIIGSRIRNERVARRMTQAELAEMSGLSVSFLSDLENGKRGLSVLSLLKIARAIGRPPQWFLRNME